MCVWGHECICSYILEYSCVRLSVCIRCSGLWPLPCYLHFIVGGEYKEWVPHYWCFLYFTLTDFMPTIFHTTSIWLTVLLAVQRYLHVCRSLETRHWFTLTNTVRACSVVYLIATLTQVQTQTHTHTYIHPRIIGSINAQTHTMPYIFT